MNGIMNFNFLLGYILAKDRPTSSEKFNAGLLASQFPSNSIIGTIMLQKQVATVEETEVQLKNVTEVLTGLMDHINGAADTATFGTFKDPTSGSYNSLVLKNQKFLNAKNFIMSRFPSITFPFPSPPSP